LLYCTSRGYLGGFFYEAVRLWCNALKDVLPKPERKYRRCVAVDEAKANLGKAQLFVWAARNVDSKEVLAFRCSSRTPSNTMRISHSGTKMP